MTAAPVHELREVWSSISTLGHSLSDAEWRTMTECPGWTVVDNLSHLIATERLLLGLAPDPPLAAYPGHVKNPIGERNEDAIDARRGLDPRAVLDEFDDITSRRLAALEAMSDDDFARVGPSPIGEVPYREFMRVRVFDCWAHEQDMRRALGRPGHLAGPAVTLVLQWHRRNLGYVVGKRAAAPDGVRVRFVVGSPAVDDVVVAVSNGRAAITDEPGHDDTILRCDLGTYHALLCGRVEGAGALASGGLHVDGDRQLGAAVAAAMNYLF